MTNAEELARKILDVIPPSMHRIRTEMRSVLGDELTVPQFRILVSIFRGRDRISEIAKHHGVSQAAMSKMVDGLVARGYVEKVPQTGDRRQVALRFSPRGGAFFRKTRSHARSSLRVKIASMSARDRAALGEGLTALQKLFLPERKAERE